MGAPYDPNILWPDSLDDPEPPDPRLYALIMKLQGFGGPGATGSASNAGSLGDRELAPHQMAAQVLGAYNASQPAAGGPMSPVDQDSLALGGAPPPPTTAMAAADAPDQGDGPPIDDALDEAATQPAGMGAPAAASLAVPAAAKVPLNGPPAGASPPSSALDPTGQFLRPELSAGPDSLVANWAAAHPDAIPPGLVVDPKTGSVLRWRPGGDPSNPDAATLEPLDPQSKQALLERIVGAPNAPLGAAMSPQEAQARAQLPTQGTLDRLPPPNPREQALLNLIAQEEGVGGGHLGAGSDYDATIDYGKYGALPVSTSSLGDIDAYQTRVREMPGYPHKAVPVGKYNLTQQNLNDIKKNFRVSDDVLLGGDLQERIGRQLLRKRRLDAYLAGNLSAQDFQRNLMKEWVSLPDPVTGKTSAGKEPIVSNREIGTAIDALKASKGAQ